jgi:hypothetical protein
MGANLAYPDVNNLDAGPEFTAPVVTSLPETSPALLSR